MTNSVRRLAFMGLALSIASAAIAQPVSQWRSVEADAQGGLFFDQTSLKAGSANTARATFAMAWKASDDTVYDTFTIKNVWAVEESWEADCGANTLGLLGRNYYAEHGEHLKEVRPSAVSKVAPRLGSKGVPLLNLLCGRPQVLGVAVEGGPEALIKFVRTAQVAARPQPVGSATPATAGVFIYVINATGHPFTLIVDGESSPQMPQLVGAIRPLKPGRHLLAGDIAGGAHGELAVDLNTADLAADGQTQRGFWCFMAAQRQTGELVFLPNNRELCGKLLSVATKATP